MSGDQERGVAARMDRYVSKLINSRKLFTVMGELKTSHRVEVTCDADRRPRSETIHLDVLRPTIRSAAGMGPSGDLGC